MFKLLVLSNLIDEKIVLVKNINDSNEFLRDVISKQLNKKRNSINEDLIDELIDYNGFNQIIFDYLVSIEINSEQISQLKSFKVVADSFIFSLIIPGWDGETSEDFKIELKGLKKLTGVKSLILDGRFIRSKSSIREVLLLKKIYKIKVYEARLTDYKFLFMVRSLKEIDLRNTNFPNNKEIRLLLDNYLSEEGLLEYQGYNIDSSAAYINIKKYIKKKDFSGILEMINKSLDVIDVKEKRKYLLRKKVSIIKYKYSYLAQCYKQEEIPALNELLGLLEPIDARYYSKSELLGQIGVAYLRMRDLNKSIDYIIQALSVANVPNFGINETQINSLIHLAVNNSEVNKIEKVLTMYAKVNFNLTGWSFSWARYSWVKLLENKFNKSGLEILKEYIGKVGYSSYASSFFNDFLKYTLPLLNRKPNKFISDLMWDDLKRENDFKQLLKDFVDELKDESSFQQLKFHSKYKCILQFSESDINN